MKKIYYVFASICLILSVYLFFVGDFGQAIYDICFATFMLILAKEYPSSNE